jgi:excisionase family DNA binding protein
VALRKFYTTKQIADLCGVHITTAIRWIDSGELRAFRTPGGRRRVALEDLRQFVGRHNIPVARRLARERPMVLVVDDDPLVLRAIARQLNNSERYQVLTAASGYDALLMVGAQLPDLVVLDLLMPGMDGFEVCSSIKRNPDTAHVVIVAVTGRFTPEVEQRVLQLGAHSCLPKEQAVTSLSPILDAALQRDAG